MLVISIFLRMIATFGRFYSLLLLFLGHSLVHSLTVPRCSSKLTSQEIEKKKRSPILSQQDFSSCSCSGCADSWTPIPTGLPPVSRLPSSASTLVSALCLASKIFNVSIVRTLPTTPPSKALKKYTFAKTISVLIFSVHEEGEFTKLIFLVSYIEP